MNKICLTGLFLVIGFVSLSQSKKQQSMYYISTVAINDFPIYSQPSLSTEYYVRGLKRGTKVKVYEYADGYWRFMYKKKIYYCLSCEFSGKEITEIKEAVLRQQREEKRKLEEAELEEQRQRYAEIKEKKEAKRKAFLMAERERDSITAINQSKRDAEYAAKRKKEIEEARRIRKERLLSKYGNGDGMRIFEHKIWIGMTKEMLRDSYGPPYDINRTVTANKVSEQWVYSGGIYVYVDNGIVTAYQD